MSKPRISPELRAYFSKLGKKGGKIGGRRSLETMTPAERSARAKNASLAAAAGRRARAKQTPN